jgi:hypothetical protein
LRAPETLRAMPVVAFLLVGSPMPDRSRGRSRMKRVTLALQVGGWALSQLLSPGKKSNAKKSQPRNAGLINGGRLKGVNRNKNIMIHTGTWNVMTMLKPGKIHEIVDQMVKIHLQIIALQEIRWKGCGKLKKDKHSLYYSCSHQNTRQLGTGFMVKREIVKNIISFQPYSEKICKLD